MALARRRCRDHCRRHCRPRLCTPWHDAGTAECLSSARFRKVASAPAASTSSSWVTPTCRRARIHSERGAPGRRIVAHGHGPCSRQHAGEGATVTPVRHTDRTRRLATATARVIRPGTVEAAKLDTADDAFWEQVPVGKRLLFAFQLSIQQWRLHGWREDRRGRRLSRSVARVRRP